MRNENVSESIDTSLYFIEIMSFIFPTFQKDLQGIYRTIICFLLSNSKVKNVIHYYSNA